MLTYLLFLGFGLCAYRFVSGEAPAVEAATFSVPSAAHSLAAVAVVKARLVASGTSPDIVAGLDSISDLLREGQQL